MCVSLHVATRVCHCNGSWGPVHCSISVELVEEQVRSDRPLPSHLIYSLCLQVEVSPEAGLVTLLELPPDSINNSQRLTILESAFRVQMSRVIGVRMSFVEVS